MTNAEERRGRRMARTKREIAEAGAALFEQHGFVRTTVDQIAERADVSPATVYSVAGGKAGVLTALLDGWATDSEAVDVSSELVNRATALQVLEFIGDKSAQAQTLHGRTMQITAAAAPHNELARNHLDAMKIRYRKNLLECAERICELAGAPAASRQEVADTLWFYFGYDSWATLRRDLGWPIERGRAWLVCQAEASLTDRSAGDRSR